MDKTNGSGRPRIEILFQESYRKIIHTATAVFIIPLRWLGFWYAVGFSIAAFFWNLWAMPRWFSQSLRPREKQKGYSRGMLSYSLCVLLLAVLFPIPILAAGWAVLSLADGLAALTGGVLGKSRLPWNKNKTWIGSLVFLLAAILFGALAFVWARGLTPDHSLYSSPVSLKWIGFLWQKTQGDSYSTVDMSIMLNETREYFMLYFAIAGILSALIESLPISKLDDNLSAPLAYSLALVALFLLLLPFILHHPFFAAQGPG